MGANLFLHWKGVAFCANIESQVSANEIFGTDYNSHNDNLKPKIISLVSDCRRSSGVTIHPAF
jgi:hypothetical protein